MPSDADWTGSVTNASGADHRRRAEFPPRHFWRRWVGDAAAPVAPRDETAEQLAEVPAYLAGRSSARSAPVDAPYRVLIVEDDPSQALFAETVLQGAGMQAQVASVPSGVMAAIDGFAPDLILMDLHMPGMDGAELTGLIRESARHQHVPIVFLTGDEDPERQYEVLELGADDFLTKPVRPRHLISAIENRVRRARALNRPASSDDPRHPPSGLLPRGRMFERLSQDVPVLRNGAVFFLEIEGVSALRDRLGFDALDSMLAEASQRIGEIASPHATTRLNDNSFLVFGTALDDKDLPAWSRSLRDGLAHHSFSVGDESLRLRSLIGYAALSHAFKDGSSAVSAAEQALRDARGTSSGIAGWEPPPQVDVERTRTIGDMLREALAGNGVELAYQPIVAVAGNQDAQYQTLMRVRDSGGQVLTAAEILPAAETAGLVHELDQQVLRLAISVLQQRREQSRPIRLFVTQSPRSLTREGYAEALLGDLAVGSIDGQSLVIDIREQDALVHAMSLHDFSRRMMSAGVQLCLSQFTASAEASALLAHLPLSFVRLASRFSSDLGDTNVRDALRAAIDHAHRQGLQVIGQQVEDPQSAATLWMSGVDFIQGNLVQRVADGLDFDFQHSVL